MNNLLEWWQSLSWWQYSCIALSMPFAMGLLFYAIDRIRNAHSKYGKACPQCGHINKSGEGCEICNWDSL